MPRRHADVSDRRNDLVTAGVSDASVMYETRRFRALGHDFRVRCSDPTLGEYLDEIFAALDANGPPGDQTVTYDKAGWVFWMLLNHLGRERGLVARLFCNVCI